MTTFAELVDAIATAPGEHIVVGVSGFGGSGKSTLVRRLVASIPDSARIRGDDFLDPVRSHVPSDDWDGMERMRLRQEVLDPFRAGRAGEFRRYDWSVRALGAPEPIPDARVLIVDAVGLLHPEIADALDISIWVDVDQATAIERGKRRDVEQGSDHDALWDNAWTPTEVAFVARFNPRENADFLYEQGTYEPEWAREDDD
jgi:uridine kinase